MNELQPFDDTELYNEYVQQATWFWFDASTREMNLEANFHRLAARCLLHEMRQRGIAEPDSDLIYEQARRTFPRDDLRMRE